MTAHQGIQTRDAAFFVIIIEIIENVILLNIVYIFAINIITLYDSRENSDKKQTNLRQPGYELKNLYKILRYEFFISNSNQRTLD